MVRLKVKGQKNQCMMTSNVCSQSSVVHLLSIRCVLLPTLHHCFVISFRVVVKLTITFL